MLCYRDMMFCSDTCANFTCRRNLTTIDIGSYQQNGLPVTVASFKDNCEEYLKPTKSQTKQYNDYYAKLTSK